MRKILLALLATLAMASVAFPQSDPRPVPNPLGKFVIQLESIAFCDTLGGMDTTFVSVPLWVMNTELGPHPRYLKSFFFAVAFNENVLLPVTTGFGAGFFTPDTTAGNLSPGGYEVTYPIPSGLQATCNSTGALAGIGVFYGALDPGVTGYVELPYMQMVHLGDFNFYYLTAPPNGVGTLTYVAVDCRAKYPVPQSDPVFETVSLTGGQHAEYGYGRTNTLIINSCVRLGDTANCKAPACPNAPRWAPCARCPPELVP